MSYYIGVISAEQKGFSVGLLEAGIERALELRDELQDSDGDDSIYVVMKSEDSNSLSIFNFCETMNIKVILIDNPSLKTVNSVLEEESYKLLTSSDHSKNVEDFKKNIDVLIFFGEKLTPFVTNNISSEEIPVIKIG